MNPGPLLTLDGYAAPQPGTRGGNWDKNTTLLDEHRLAQYSQTQLPRPSREKHSITEPLSFKVVVSRRRRYAAATDGPCTALLGLSALIGRFPE